MALSRKWLFFIGMTSLGLIGNVVHLPLYFGVDFIFGSIFSMLILQTLGPRWGLASSLVISSYTIRLWHHPYAVVIFVAEVGAVFLISRRWRLTYFVADLFFWLVPGLVLVLAFYWNFLSMSPENAVFIWLKQAFNGLLNVGIMRSLYYLYAAIFRKSRISLSEMSFDFMALLILIPALFQVSYHVRDSLNSLQNETEDQLVSTRKAIVITFSKWFSIHERQLAYLSNAAVDQSVSSMQEKLDQTLKMGGDFLRLGYMNSQGISVAYSPTHDEFGKSNIGKDFSDRHYQSKLRTMMSPMLTEVMPGRIGTPQPIVAMLNPVVADGNFMGYVGGVIELKNLETYVSDATENTALPLLTYLVKDHTGKVIFSNNEKKIGTQYHSKISSSVELNNGLFLDQPPQELQMSAIERWKTTKFLTEIPLGEFDEWSLVLEEPIAPLQQKIFDRGRVQLVWVFVFLLFCIGLITAFHGNAFKSFLEIKEISRDIPEKIKSGNEISWPETQIEENKQIVEGLKTMTQLISGLFTEINENNRLLDQRVEERTDELKIANERLQRALDEIKTLRGILPICSYCKKIRNDDGYFEQIEMYIHKHSGVDFSHTICPNCIKEHFSDLEGPSNS